MSYSNIATNANIIDASTIEDTFQESSFLEKNSMRNDLEQTGVHPSPVCMSVIPELRNVPEHWHRRLQAQNRIKTLCMKKIQT